MIEGGIHSLRLVFRLVSAITLVLCHQVSALPQSATDLTRPFYEWTAPSPENQLARDSTAIPPGQGAIFAPTLTEGRDEPGAVVFQGGRQVASGLTGQRIIVEPGAYVIRIGSGSAAQQVLQIPVEVRPNETTLVPVTWGGLKVEVVDANNVPHRGSFELLRVSDRQPFAIGFGADTLVGERLRTLLVPAGLYRIVRPGTEYQTRTNFSTVLIPEASLVHYSLVLDPASGNLLGSGVVPPDELGEVTEGSPWNRQYALGLGVPIASTSNVVGANNQTSVGADIIFDLYLTHSANRNYTNFAFEIEEGFVRVNPEASDALPVQKTRDRMRMDMLYTRFVTPRVGPYGRFGVLTSAFDSHVLVTEDTTLVRQFLDGSTTVELIPANGRFRTGNRFSPALIREGAGVNLRLLQERESFVDLRGGVGARQNLFDGVFVREKGLALQQLITGQPLPPGEPIDGTLGYTEVASFNQTGAETTIVGATSIGRLLINTNFDLFADFRAFRSPTLDWRNTVGWRLTRNLSADYTVSVLRIPQVINRNQIRHGLLFRYSWGT